MFNRNFSLLPAIFVTYERLFEKSTLRFEVNFVIHGINYVFQEEYVAENIKWTPIEYSNNAVVVELLEGKRPPGLFLILDDVCATLHGGSTGADADLQKVTSKLFIYAFTTIKIVIHVIYRYIIIITNP